MKTAPKEECKRFQGRVTTRRASHLAMFFAALFCFTASGEAAVITVPADLSLGDKYRLAFVSSYTWYGYETTLFYNNQLTSVANNSNPAWAHPDVAALGAEWFLLGSTNTAHARDNTGTNPNVSVGVPLYRLDGQRIADNNADLWDGSLAVPLNISQVGIAPPNVGTTKVWTGTQDNGTAYIPLGGGNPNLGDYTSTSGWENIFTTSNSSQLYWLYGISEELTVVPEPATALLVAAGLAGLALRKQRSS